MKATVLETPTFFSFPHSLNIVSNMWYANKSRHQSWKNIGEGHTISIQPWQIKFKENHAGPSPVFIAALLESEKVLNQSSQEQLEGRKMTEVRSWKMACFLQHHKEKLFTKEVMLFQPWYFLLATTVWWVLRTRKVRENAAWCVPVEGAKHLVVMPNASRTKARQAQVHVRRTLAHPSFDAHASRCKTHRPNALIRLEWRTCELKRKRLIYPSICLSF